MIVMRVKNSAREACSTRRHILDAAIRLYRLLGQKKTSVADIARESSMSPANVYRFFASKQAINNAVADKLFEEVIVVAVEASHTPGTAADRLRETLAAIEQRHADRFRNERKLHELVATSLRENWSISRSFTERIESIVAGIISDGMVRGEFQNGDSMLFGRSLLAATAVFCDPRLMSATASFHRPTLEQMMDFAIEALGADSATRFADDLPRASREMVPAA
jgi:AcrR family transcriptional regulator